LEHSEAPGPDSQSVEPNPPVIEARPWPRYWARALDLQIFSFPASLLFVYLLPQVLTVPYYLQGVFITPVALLIEAFVLVIFGWTPGKWLLGISVRTAAGGPVTFAAAVRRYADLFWRGLGCGLPIVTLFTAVTAQGRLEANRNTTWDLLAGLRVTHVPIPWWKHVLFVGALLGLMWLRVWLD
jgi:hypothetical protein